MLKESKMLIFLFFFLFLNFILEDKDSELNPHSFYKNDSIKEVYQ